MACSEKIAKKIHEWATDNYENGGDVIVECESVANTMETYDSLVDAKRHCKIRAEHKADIRGYGDCDAQEADNMRFGMFDKSWETERFTDPNIDCNGEPC